MHYISAPTGTVALFVTDSLNAVKTSNLYFTDNDHLGSLQNVYDEQGNTLYQLNFDAWGRRRDINSFTYTTASQAGLPDWLYRGYTGHEHLEAFDLIDMNGRMYDPKLGLFLSPDPYNQNPEFTQNYNRYAYAYNNPLKYTDPTGEVYSLGQDDFMDPTGNEAKDLENNNGDKDKGKEKADGNKAPTLVNPPPPPKPPAIYLNPRELNMPSPVIPELAPEKFDLNTTSLAEPPPMSNSDLALEGVSDAMAQTYLSVVSLGTPEGLFGAMFPAINMILYQDEIAASSQAFMQMVIDEPAYGAGYAAEKFLEMALLGRLMPASISSESGVTVLGKYPDYINLAENLGARKFSVPTKFWNRMSASEQWIANQKFLDRTRLRGDNVIVSNPIIDINRVSGAFRNEINYMIDKGYRLNNSGNQLIR